MTMPLALSLAPVALPARPAPSPVPSSPAGVAITLRGLGKAFGPKQVLAGVDVHVPAGQFVAVVGKSGCGKSTLLRLVVGLEEPSQGLIRVGDGASGRDSARLMFQEPRLLPWARVGENVEIGLGTEGTKADRRGQALRALDEVGLADRAGEWPSVLSGGQKQRVALARALVSRPRLLAFDEPLGALDALTRIEMQGLIERVWQAQGFTALLVTHDVAEAVALADRVLVIDSGRVALDLPVDVPRPRRRGDPALARLEGRIFEHLFTDQGAGI
ncbi:MAG: ATP-binding cassette domain-containing protein [Methylobacteriaceae bacterium]|nr:ATP-binding cassette domain-containing protein [Methylobacteriaceae bacterium]